MSIRTTLYRVSYDVSVQSHYAENGGHHSERLEDELARHAIVSALENGHGHLPDVRISNRRRPMPPSGVQIFAESNLTHIPRNETQPQPGHVWNVILAPLRWLGLLATPPERLDQSSQDEMQRKAQMALEMLDQPAPKPTPIDAHAAFLDEDRKVRQRLAARRTSPIPTLAMGWSTAEEP